MSGPIVSRALRRRFESIRQVEIERLRKKLLGLSEEDRRSVDAITAEVIAALARMPERALEQNASQSMLQVLVRLFRLDDDLGRVS